MTTTNIYRYQRSTIACSKKQNLIHRVSALNKTKTFEKKQQLSDILDNLQNENETKKNNNNKL